MKKDKLSSLCKQAGRTKLCGACHNFEKLCDHRNERSFRIYVEAMRSWHKTWQSRPKTCAA